MAKATGNGTATFDPDLAAMDIPAEVAEQVQIELKYEGYLQRQQQHVERMRKAEDWRMPSDLDYSAIASLRTESRKKLSQIRPLTLGQASRISGVTPADISILMIHLGARKQSAALRKG